MTDRPLRLQEDLPLAMPFEYLHPIHAQQPDTPDRLFLLRIAQKTGMAKGAWASIRWSRYNWAA